MRTHSLLRGILLCCGLIVTVNSQCPCENPDWCKPITAADRKEVFLFSKVNTVSTLSKFDWSRTTTICVEGTYDNNLICLAHQHNVRVVPKVDYPGADLTNATKRSAWVQQQLKTVQNNYLDGVNIDFEEAIPKTDTDRIQGLTDLVNETYRAFKQANPHYQVTMDVPFGPNCVYNRCYDYRALAFLLDFFFIMDYDEWGGSVAGPNSGIQRTIKGLQGYMQIIPSLKLLMGVPWYGYKYKCSKVTQHGECIKDGEGSQLEFKDIYNLLYKTSSQRLWNKTELSPFFTYDTATKSTYQVWYDDPESLIYKYDAAAKHQLRGVGVWHADCVDYGDTPLANAVKQWMWDALPLVNYPWLTSN